MKLSSVAAGIFLGGMSFAGSVFLQAGFAKVGLFFLFSFPVSLFLFSLVEELLKIISVIHLKKVFGNYEGIWSVTLSFGLLESFFAGWKSPETILGHLFFTGASFLFAQKITKSPGKLVFSWLFFSVLFHWGYNMGRVLLN